MSEGGQGQVNFATLVYPADWQTNLKSKLFIHFLSFWTFCDYGRKFQESFVVFVQTPNMLGLDFGLRFDN